MPRIRYEARECIVDERLRKFRSVSCPPGTIEFVPFETKKGRSIRIAYLFERRAPGRADR